MVHALLTVLGLSAVVLIPPYSRGAPRDRDALEHFEKHVRPVLAGRCWKCHGPEKAKGGLRLDTAAGLREGGDSGPPVIPGQPDKSLLIQAVRQIGDLKMPPDGRLPQAQVDALVRWVVKGAAWPAEQAAVVVPQIAAPRSSTSASPDAPTIRPHLQAWYRADSIRLSDGRPVQVWPDVSGQGRDLTLTAGVREGGVGEPPQFISASSINRRPAVRFQPGCGLATSPDRPVAIQGNSELTIFLVMNLQTNDTQPPYDGILGIGDPANPTGDPGKPLAALVQIRRTAKPELQLAGGWNHDASLGAGSFTPYIGRPTLLAIVKKPGPMNATTRFFLNGTEATDRSVGLKISGTAGVPEIRHRGDMGLYLGKAMAWCGSIRGDIGEVIVYNRAIDDRARSEIEQYLADKHGLFLPRMLASTSSRFTPAQTSFWAFQPVKSTVPPDLKGAAGQDSAIDNFLGRRLESERLVPAGSAGKRAWIRRATFGLTGLPPTPAEIESFLADNRPDAFDRVVERLLASPHYGERWGRHWLDIVRYAETTANDANAVMRYACRYRNYVVSAFNRDTPYDQFITEQLAGDLLTPSSDPVRTAEQIIATGFLMIGPKALAETDKEQSRLDIIDDQIDVIGRAFLGLTVGCARCHDHKFDPIPTMDYYSLAGILRSTEVFQDEVRNASMWQEWPLNLPLGASPMVVMAPREGLPVNLRVHIRGSHQTLGTTAPRRFLQILAGANHAPLATSQSGRLELARWIADKHNPLTARVMVNRIWQNHFGTGLVATSDNFGTRGEAPSHPDLLDWLAARFVEDGWSIKALHRRILLSQAYRRGSTFDARAFQVDPASRLLWRMPIRRLSAEEVRDAMLAVSGRLDAAIGGNEAAEFLYARGEVIDKKRDFFRPNRLQADDTYYLKSCKRSIYLPVVRNAMPDVLALFDGADPNGVTATRNDTTVPAQALFLLNHPFVREQALYFALRLERIGPDDAERLRVGFMLALGRPPTQDEREDCLDFLQAYERKAVLNGTGAAEARRSGLQALCQTLFCRNEFLYVY